MPDWYLPKIFKYKKIIKLAFSLLPFFNFIPLHDYHYQQVPDESERFNYNAVIPSLLILRDFRGVPVPVL